MKNIAPKFVVGAALAVRFFAACALAVPMLSPTAALASQASQVVPGPPEPMTKLAADITAALQAIATCNSGPSAPTVGPANAPIAFMCWWNTVTTPAVLNYWDGSQWVATGITLNLTSHVFNIAAAAVTLPALQPGQFLGNNGSSPAPAAAVNYSSIGNGGTTGITDQFGNYLFSIGGLPAQANGGATNGTILSFSSQVCGIGDEDFAITGTPTAGEQPGFTYIVGATTATVKYTVQAGDTNGSIAAGIVAAAKANAQFQSLANGNCPNGVYYNGVATLVQFGSSASGGFDPIYTADPNGAGNSWTAINSTHTTVTVTPVSTYTGNIEENYVVGITGRHSVVGDAIKTNTTTYPDDTGTNRVFFEEVDQAHNVSTPSVLRQWLTGGCDYTWLISSGIAFFGPVNGCSLDIVANGLSTSSMSFATGAAGNITFTPGSGGLVLDGPILPVLGSDATGDLYYRNSSGQLTRLAIGGSGLPLVVSGGLPAWAALGIAGGGTGYTAAPVRSFKSLTGGSLSSIASTSYQQLGFKGSITPATSGNVMVTFIGEEFAGALDDICFQQVSYGTGTAPNNGASAAGTVIGAPVRNTLPSNGGYTPFALTAYITGLTPSTTYWLDLQIKDSTTSCQVGAIQAVAIEE
jgi:hypothetical protein